MSDQNPVYNGGFVTSASATKRGRGSFRGRGRGRGGFSTQSCRGNSTGVSSAPMPLGIAMQRLRDVPPYVQHKSSSSKHLHFNPDPWDVSNQQAMIETESQFQGMDMQGLYEKFQQMRERERREMEKRGLVDKQEAKKKLEDAIKFVGSCTGMCPIFERVRRTFENNVKSFEKDPQTGKVTTQYAIKAFSRPAAGQPPPLPSDVRPPHVLKSTLSYLVSSILPELPRSHSFLWDRTRSIRQDFTYQNYSGVEAIECNEIIARIHIVCLHVMAGSDVEWSQQQELEQLHKTLRTLTEIYDDSRQRDIQDSPNEAEIRSYQLLAHLNDNEIESRIQKLPHTIFSHSLVQQALEIRRIYQSSDFALFFRTITQPSTPVLFLCLLEPVFNRVRLDALRAMSRSFHSRGKPYQLDRLTTMLGFDSSSQATSFCKYYGFVITENQEIDFNSFSENEIAQKLPLNQAHQQYISDRLSHISQLVCQNVESSLKADALPTKRLQRHVVNDWKATNTMSSLSTPFSGTPPSNSSTVAKAERIGWSLGMSNQIQPQTASKSLLNRPSETAARGSPPEAKAQPSGPALVSAESNKPRPIESHIIQAITDNLISQCLTQSIYRILQYQWKYISDQRSARNALIEQASQTIYSQLLSSVVEKVESCSFALHHNDKRLKLWALRKIHFSAVRALELKHKRQRKQDEFKNVAGSLGHADKDLSREVKTHSLRFTDENKMVEDIDKTRNETIALWAQLSYENAIMSLSESLFRNPSFPHATLKIAVFSSDWESASSGQWFRVKLGLVWDGDSSSTYRRDLTPRISIGALQNKKASYKDVALLLIETGLHGPEYDANAISQIVSSVSRASSYEVSVLVVDFGLKKSTTEDFGLKCTPYTFDRAFNSLVRDFIIQNDKLRQHEKQLRPSSQIKRHKSRLSIASHSTDSSLLVERRPVGNLPILPLPMESLSKRLGSQLELAPKPNIKKFAMQGSPASSSNSNQSHSKLAELRRLVAQVKAGKA